MNEIQQASNGAEMEVTPEAANAIVAMIHRAETAEARVEVLDKKLALTMKEMQQYMADLKMWMQAHANEYPGRRMVEVQKTLEQIASL